MKLVTTLVLSCFLLSAYSQTKQPVISTPDTTKKILTVETACGQCMFGMKAKGCTLAVRLEGKAYFVEGTEIDDHGDAHADDGFCNAIRKANVQGEVVNEKFKVTYYKLLAVKKEKETEKQNK